MARSVKEKTLPKKGKKDDPMEKAHEAFSFISSSLKKALEDGGKIDSAIFAVFKQPDGEIGVIPVPLNDTYDSEERLVVASTVGTTFALRGTQVLLFSVAGEAWVHRGDGKKKEEAFVYAARDAEGKMIHGLFSVEGKGKTRVVTNAEKTGLGELSPNAWVKPTAKQETGFPILNVAWDAYHQNDGILYRKEK